MWTKILHVFAFKVILGLQIKLASCFLTVSYTSTFRMGNIKPMMQAETKISSSLPSMIVFDLDNTIWTPELYILRRSRRDHELPVAGKDVQMFSGAQRVIEIIRTDSVWQEVQFAVASRTQSVDWAHHLLREFGLRDLFQFVEIFPGDKKSHFSNLQRNSGIPYCEMLFFDDSRDGKYGNCLPVSELGVLSVHCPHGLHTEDIFHTAIERFREWQSLESRFHAVVEEDGSLTPIKRIGAESLPRNGKSMNGIIKMINQERQFGFIRPRDKSAKDMFFHFSNLHSSSDQIERGDKVSFVSAVDPKNGRNIATNIELASSKRISPDTVEMRVFSMNLPFAALLANGYKTLETRNGTMFTPYPEGTKMLLHVGQRIYPDEDKHIEVMKSGGLTIDEISKLKSLPEGYGKGMAVAICEIGKTFETTLEQRSDPNFQRRVGAFGADSGRMATEIKRVEFLKRPIRLSGQGGVFKAQVEIDVIPEGWR